MTANGTLAVQSSPVQRERAVLRNMAGFIIEDQRAALRRRREQTVAVGLDDDLDL